MIQVFKNQSLLPYHTFGIAQSSEVFIPVKNETEILEALDYADHHPSLILGGGSNILPVKDISGITIHLINKGIEVLPEVNNRVLIRVASGEVWHTFVLFCIENGYAGVENLSLIPGSVGAGPMQNIGAYGVELEQVFHSLEAIHIPTLEKRIFYKEECAFGYRSSIFKTVEKGNYLITSVTFALSKTPVFHTQYGAIEKELEMMGVQELSIRAISDAVIRIRKSKLPDPKQIGNAGSFFKNPVVSLEHHNSLKAAFPEMVAYPAPGGMKLAAGWLIEKAGWKGFREKDAGVHQHQALVLVNYGKASGAEIFRLSERIIADIQEKFGVLLEREVNLI